MLRGYLDLSQPKRSASLRPRLLGRLLPMPSHSVSGREPYAVELNSFPLRMQGCRHCRGLISVYRAVALQRSADQKA